MIPKSNKTKIIRVRDENQLPELERQLFLEGIYQYYGWDFRNYAVASIKRRIQKCMLDEKVSTISGFQDKILHMPAVMERFLITMSIDVTAMFRDPRFYQAFRQKVIPRLRSMPTVRIWHIGCATGEEVYSMAILLQEEGLYDRSRLYATDMNEFVLEKAKTGIYQLKQMKDYTDNYLAAGGQRSFSEYYTAKYEHAILRQELKKNIIWAQHNLATDGSFNEFQVILCRNVMIYFNQTLQNRVHKLIYDSLGVMGVLGLGSKESLEFTPYQPCYQPLEASEKLYLKIK